MLPQACGSRAAATPTNSQAGHSAGLSNPADASIRPVLEEILRRLQRLEDRAAPGHVDDARFLFRREVALELDLHREAVDVAGRRRAVGAVLGVHAVVHDRQLTQLTRRRRWTRPLLRNRLATPQPI